MDKIDAERGEAPVDHMQDRFDEQAEALGLELEKETFESCSIGIALVVGESVDKLSDHSPTRTPASVGAMPAEDDAGAIAELIRLWDTTHPDDLETVLPQAMLDPFVVVSANYVGAVSHATLLAAREGDAFKEELVRYPVLKPRVATVTVDPADVQMIGDHKAWVTYKLEETYKGGKRYAGRGAAALVKADGKGWRIAVYSRHDKGLGYDELAGTGEERGS